MPTSNEAKISHYLGVDYGRAKIGLSMAESETKMAFRYGTLSNNKEIFRKMAEIISKEDIDIVVIGVPSYINEDDTEYESEDFGHTLKSYVPRIKIQFANEMFTTKMAQNNLIAKGVKGVKKHDHEEAARIILQSWLDADIDH